MTRTLTAERLAHLESKVGITKDGTKNGNGLIESVENIKKDVSILSDKVNKNADEIKDLKRIHDGLKTIESSIQQINKELEGNISFKTVSKAKNIFLGILATLISLGTVWSLVEKIYSVFRK